MSNSSVVYSKTKYPQVYVHSRSDMSIDQVLCDHNRRSGTIRDAEVWLQIFYHILILALSSNEPFSWMN